MSEEAGRPSCVADGPLQQQPQVRGFRGVIHGADRATECSRAFLPRLQGRQVLVDRIGRTGAWPGAEGDERLRRVHGDEFRMGGGAVVALDEVLHHEFPIGIRRVGADVRDLGIGEAMEIEIGREIPESRIEIDRRFVG